MVNYTIIAMAILLGYTTAVAVSLITTMGIAASAPAFVVRDFRVRSPYKMLHEILWFLGALLGGLVTALAGMGISEWKAKLGLCVLLVLMLWRNSWEARQRGTAHQIFISVLTVAGVFCGYLLSRRF